MNKLRNMSTADKKWFREQIRSVVREEATSNPTTENTKTTPKPSNRTIYLRQIARMINAANFSERWKVDDDGTVTDGGVLVKTDRLKANLEALVTQLEHNGATAKWLLGLWEINAE